MESTNLLELSLSPTLPTAPWSSSTRSPAEDHPHAWQRTADGRSAVVGSSFLGEEVESYTDQADAPHIRP